MSQAYEESPEIDLQSLEKLTLRLHEALQDHQKDPANFYILDSVIKRFELTYELATRSLRRYLIECSITKSEVADMSFAGIIRRGDKEGLLKTGWPDWNKYREAHNETVHAYQEENARKTAVDAALFLPEAEHLLDNLKRRLAPHE